MIPQLYQYVFLIFTHALLCYKPLSQHNLPALSTPRRVHALTAAQRDAYYVGYYDPEGALPPHSERIPMILSAIGVMT